MIRVRPARICKLLIGQTAFFRFGDGPESRLAVYQQQRLLLFTVAIPAPEKPWLTECFSICHDTMARYALRIGADLLTIHQRRLGHVSRFPHVEKFNVRDYLDRYDRVLFLDSDVFIKPTAPNIFDICGETNKLYILDQVDHLDGYPDVKNWHDYCHAFLRSKSPAMPRIYYNTGVMLMSRQHQGIFDTQGYFDGPAWEQEFLIYRIVQRGDAVAKLPWEFNTILRYSTAAHKEQAHFLHLGQDAKMAAAPLWKRYYAAV
jgi:hypothetical protein